MAEELCTLLKILSFHFFHFSSTTSLSQDVEEIIVKGDWREINVLEEDLHCHFNNQIIESQ